MKLNRTIEMGELKNIIILSFHGMGTSNISFCDEKRFQVQLFR